MIRRGTRIQLVAFAILAVVGVVYAGITYAGLGRLFVTTTYTVHMRMSDSGGIFSNAAVSYRGVTVGRVGELHPRKHGVVVDLEIDKDAPPIPRDGLEASVRNLSLIGELYVNLVPSTKHGPVLHEGSTIPDSQTSIPVPPGQLLAHVNGLLRSVPRDALSTVIRELDTALSGTGPELQRVLDSTSALVDSAKKVLPETRKLIKDGRTVLGTQNATADSIKAFSKHLLALSGQLKESDADLNELISIAPRAGNQISALLRESGPGISRLIADLLTTSRLLAPREQALEQLLITYPMLARAGHSAVPGDGYVHFGLVVNVFQPVPCTTGYEGTDRRPGRQTSDVAVNRDATCVTEPGSPIAVRGSQNIPHHRVPDAVPAPVDSETANEGPATQNAAGSASSEQLPPLPGPAGLPGQPLVPGPGQILAE